MQVTLDSPWTLLSPAWVQPLYGAGRKESSGTGLKQTTTATATGTLLNKRLMSRTIAVHVRYKSLYVSLPFSAKQQRDITGST